MRHRIALPPPLGPQFSVSEAAALGVGRGRHSARDLARPFHGVRAVEPPATFGAAVACYLPRLRPGQRFGGRTAARLWGLPLPTVWRTGEPIDVVVPTGTCPPRTRGVRGTRLAEDRAVTWSLAGAKLIDPIAAFFTCAKEVTLLDAVVIIDALISDAGNYPARGARRPVRAEDVGQRLDEWGRFPGCGTVRRALALARPHVESPKETETRMLLLAHGLPEPEVQHEVRSRDGLIARVDLAYPSLRIAIEYEGDGHRTGKEQWRADIRRQRDLEDLGWTVIRITELDLRDGGASVVARLRGVFPTQREAA
ncbi:hypothetical protein [Microbacterium sp.]|uniref:endonuclease domain-containing protein n=1 Tax=Microbacterium sp. TaxID=51671 RepID=UPI003341CA23